MKERKMVPLGDVPDPIEGAARLAKMPRFADASQRRQNATARGGAPRLGVKSRMRPLRGSGSH
jgi:hypothetical protein